MGPKGDSIAGDQFEALEAIHFHLSSYYLSIDQSSIVRSLQVDYAEKPLLQKSVKYQHHHPK